MLRNLNVTTGGRRILGTPFVGILAEQIAADTATGDSGAGLLYDRAIEPSNAGKYLRLRVVTLPLSGILTIDEDGQNELSGADDGVHTLVYNEYADNVLLGSDTATYRVGVVDAAFPSATLTATTSITAGVLSGEQNATLTGVTLAATSSITAGSITGGVAGGATFSGATLTASTSITAGEIIGQRHATMTGAELVASAGIVAGDITAGSGVSATFPGAILSTGSGGAYPTAAEIAAAILAAAQITPICANTKQINNAAVTGDGTVGNNWRAEGVPP